MTTAIVVMGVSGCGKSSAGRALGEALAARFVEGDSLHPDTNVEKMRAGIPLNDDDRKPWLELVGQTLATAGDDNGVIVACSALKKSYRDLLRQRAGPALRFIHLKGERDVLARRMANRPGHYMPVSLLDSQLATLEATDGEPDVLTLDCDLKPEKIAETSLAFVKAEQGDRQ
ncbi:gluconokinase [uncultured Martelella sp.]|uniref:gluconokinase n=1 Tax=uncultured Martelella sp. TaxID=392331 RepID=UPI0029C7EF5F|nr:gluconokinase [uncultured Martelella sp.]